ncbi:hypothetical protein AAMO2058_000978800 [Amorphochlora amoebiformis]|mmetsp:Transcript_1284/g.1797  ORF Transcript_1284/g.1797 Transcript_1284/m.1797 type:complete len:458 (-) Transcript_1284:140-1513(-)
MSTGDKKSNEDPGETQRSEKYEVILFYKYVLIPDVKKLVDHQKDLCRDLGLLGRVLIGPEGVNGTLSGEKAKIERYTKAVESYEGKIFDGIQWKTSTSGTHPFADLQIKQVKEIVSSGGMNINPAHNPGSGGVHLSPRSFHKALAEGSREDTVIIDVRNRWEYALGHFKTKNITAVDPDTKTYSEFKQWIDRQAETFKSKKVLMYCTGGIRCETASAYLKLKGAKNVSQLQGGIHKYLDEFGSEGFFKGKNFVFDKRVALGDPKGGKTDVVGACALCREAYDVFNPGIVCTVCRDPMLICESCQKTDPFKEWHCRDHESLRGVYFTFLDRFPSDQLNLQAKKLQELWNKIGVGKKYRNKRRTLKRQIEKIHQVLKTRESVSSSNGESNSNQDSKGTCLDSSKSRSFVLRDPPCRTCGKEGCNGQCWGFWAGKNRSWKRREENEADSPQPSKKNKTRS